MMRFFWMTFLPLSAAGGAAALLLWLARPALRRFAHIQWSVPVLTAALCLFVLPLPVFAMPGAWNAPAQAVQSSVGTVLPAEAAASEPLSVPYRPPPIRLHSDGAVRFRPAARKAGPRRLVRTDRRSGIV